MFPDSLGNGKWLFFLHGYNVSGQEARGRASEMFKRLYWSGSKARFVAVSWFGDPYHDGYNTVPDYQMAVRNAFVTAPKLAAVLNPTDYPGYKTVIAHSLGNMVVSSAIQDHGLQIDQFCMVDAAIAMEAFKGDLPQDIANLALPPWVDNNNTGTIVYNQRFWSSEWHSLWDNVSGDKRSSLTWRGQFKDIANKTSVHNFFSSTEDVLGAIAGSPTSITIHNAFGIVANDVGILGRYAWTVQEKAKGNQFTIIFPWKLTIQGSNYGGWGMNLKDPLFNNDPLYWKWVNSDNYIGRMIKTPEEIGTVSDAVLRRHPVFEPGWGEIGGQQQENTVSNVSPVDGAPSWIFNLYSAQGSALSADATNRSRLLSEAIPALTQPAGANYTSAFVTAKNHNMPAEYADKANWPDIKVGDIPVWKHGYFREMAYCYIYGLYDEFVFLSN